MFQKTDASVPISPKSGQGQPLFEKRSHSLSIKAALKV